MMAKNVYTYSLSEPLGATATAKADIDAGDGNLAIESLPGGQPMLVRGTLQYLENQGIPTHSVDMRNGLVTLTLKAGRNEQPRFRFPWAACNGATEWQIQLHPTVLLDITAHSHGGNVRLNLAGMAISRLAADTGGGNMEVVLPNNAANLDVTARTGAGNVAVEIGSGITGHNTLDANSGAGNVVVQVPSGITARIHATSGLGKVIVDSRFSPIDAATYQSPDYDEARDKVEITLHSGAGNVNVNTL